MVSPCTLKTVSLLEGIRKSVLGKIEALNETEAFFIPAGFRNSIHWHIGHMLHVQLAHWYIRRGEKLPLSFELRKYFKDGSSPEDYDASVPSFAQLLGTYKEYSFNLVEKFGSFLEEPMIEPFDFMNSHFGTVADDLQLLIYHEGEHYPMVLRILKSLKN